MFLEWAGAPTDYGCEWMAELGFSVRESDSSHTMNADHKVSQYQVNVLNIMKQPNYHAIISFAANHQ